MNSKYNSEGYKLQIKGKNAEEVIYELATKTFLQDWCFLNPKPDVGKELCDLLIVFEDTVIIWQIKDLKLDKNGHYKVKEKEKNIKQLGGAKRRMFEIDLPITLTNTKRGSFLFEPKKINNIYLISALVGEEEMFFNPIEEIKSHQVHIFNRKFIEIILNELDTMRDFSHYLKTKEEFLKTDKRIIISGGEEELLGPYLHNNRSFSIYNSADLIILENGMRINLIKRPEYIQKKKEDEISYFWDYLIEKTHQGGDNYELIASELARTSRFERRLLSKMFIEGNINADADKINNTYRRFIPMKEIGVTYCFLYQDDKIDNSRKNMLINLCYIARVEFDTPKIIGISTEQQSFNGSHDFLLMDIPVLSNQQIEEIKKFKRNLNILNNPKIKNVHEDEYPEQ